MAKNSSSAGKPKPPRGMLDAFWGWYERNYTLNITLTALLFTLQLVHLYWLSADVVASKLVGQSFFQLTSVWQYLIILVDYTEIPSLLSTTVLYLYQIRKGRVWKNVLFLFLVNSQWLHLFWITDEFVIEHLRAQHTDTGLPLWLAWVAIIIDYLELPVIADTIVKSVQAIREGRYQDVLKEEA
jgi:hypothetical protein